jgi:hypothetical protein
MVTTESERLMDKPTERDVEGLPDCEGWTCQGCGADNFIPAEYAERIAQARLDGRCASCGEPATTTSRPNGRLTLVCLRHYNVWQTPAALRGDA